MCLEIGEHIMSNDQFFFSLHLNKKQHYLDTIKLKLFTWTRIYRLDLVGFCVVFRDNFAQYLKLKNRKENMRFQTLAYETKSYKKQAKKKKSRRTSSFSKAKRFFLFTSICAIILHHTSSSMCCRFFFLLLLLFFVVSLKFTKLLILRLPWEHYVFQCEFNVRTPRWLDGICLVTLVLFFFSHQFDQLCENIKHVVSRICTMNFFIFCCFMFSNLLWDFTFNSSNMEFVGFLSSFELIF